MDWLTQHHAEWNFHNSTLILKNGSEKTSSIQLKPFRTINYGGLEEAGLNLISHRKASKYLLRTENQATLVVLRDQDVKAVQKGLNHLPDTRNPRIKAMLAKFKDLFREELPTQKPTKRDVKHHIDTQDASPINLPYYALTKQHRDELERQIRILLEKEIIRPSASPWGFPVLFVPKANGEWRMCIDYRLLNNVTLKDAYPLPRIQDCLDTIGDAKVLSKIDLTSGYYQIEMDEISIPKTAFNTRSGKYEFLAMPFGLTNAPSTFQRIMNTALQAFLGKFVIVYLDDIVIYSKNERQHEEHLRLVLNALEANELYARPSKCIIAVDELEFCGHIIGHGRCRPTASKVKAISEWPEPQNVHEVRQFLGLASYYRRYIEGFAKIAAPLSDLLVETDVELRKKKYRPIRWNASCDYAFRLLKKALSSEPVLQQVDESKPFWIETDCSEWALGCVLCQEGPDGKWRPVAYDGRKLTGAELNYPIHEKELLAIKHALRTWTAYIQNGHKTIVVTDHESLKYLHTTRTPSKRLARWIDEFSEYNLDIRYRKGEEAIVPDAISRRPDFIGKGPANRAWVGNQANLNSIEVDLPLPEKPTTTSIPANEQEDLEWEATVIEALTLKDRTALTPEHLTALRRMPDIDQFIVEDGRLYRKVNKYFVPYISTTFRRDFVEYYHRHYGHFSAPALNGVIQFRGWWPKMQRDVAEYAKRCRQCQLAQQPKVRNELPFTQARLGARPFEKWAIDFVGPLPLSADDHKQWILTAIDFATSWPVAKAVKDATDEAVADFLFEIYCQYGAFKELLSDNGTNLNSAIVEHYLAKVKVKHRTTTPYHPQTNGKVERFNGMLGKILTKMLIGTPPAGWTNYLSAALFACRVRAHSVTGISPFKLVYGIEPRLTGDERDFDTTNLDADFAGRMETMLTARHEANKLLLERGIYAQKLRSTRLRDVDTGFEIGQWVVLRNNARQKLEATYFGPFKILKKLWFGTYILETNDERVFRNPTHGSRLLEYRGDAPDSQETLTSSIQTRLRKEPNDIVNPSDEMIEVLNSREVPPTYMELSLMPKSEWATQQRSGDRSGKVGEGFDAASQTLIRERRRRQRKHKVGKDYSIQTTPSATITPSKEAEIIVESSKDTAEPLQQGEKTLPAEQMRYSPQVQPSSAIMESPGPTQPPVQGLRSLAPARSKGSTLRWTPTRSAKDYAPGISGSKPLIPSNTSLAGTLFEGPERLSGNIDSRILPNMPESLDRSQESTNPQPVGIAEPVISLPLPVEMMETHGEGDTTILDNGLDTTDNRQPIKAREEQLPNDSPVVPEESETPSGDSPDSLDGEVTLMDVDDTATDSPRKKSKKRKRPQRLQVGETNPEVRRSRHVEGRSLRPNPKPKVVRD